MQGFEPQPVRLMCKMAIVGVWEQQHRPLAQLRRPQLGCVFEGPPEGHPGVGLAAGDQCGRVGGWVDVLVGAEAPQLQRTQVPGKM